MNRSCTAGFYPLPSQTPAGWHSDKGLTGCRRSCTWGCRAATRQIQDGTAGALTYGQLPGSCRSADEAPDQQPLLLGFPQLRWVLGQQLFLI